MQKIYFIYGDDMLVKRLLLILLLVVLCGININAQSKIDMIEKLQIRDEIIALEERISKHIKNSEEFSKIQGLKLYHIFWLSVDGSKIKKEEFINYSFLDRLNPRYYYYEFDWNYFFSTFRYLFIKNKYLDNSVRITDSLGNLIGGGGVNYVRSYQYPHDYDIKLAKMFFNNEIDFAFVLNDFQTYFIKDSKIYVLKQYKTDCENFDLTIIPLEEYIDNCYEKTIWGKQ